MPIAHTYDEALAHVADLVERFRQAHGALACRVLAGVDMSTPEGLQEYRDRGLHDTLCPRYVRTACRLLEELLPGQVEA